MNIDYKLNLFDYSNIFFIALLTIISLIYIQISDSILILLFSLLLISSIVFLVKSAPKNKITLYFRRFYIIILLPFIFSFLHYFVPSVHPDFFDPILIQVDSYLFNNHPSIYLQHFHHPLLILICQISYATFYFLPFPLGIQLMRKNKMSDFYFFAFSVVTAFYISYIGYIVFPAAGPRIFLRDFYLSSGNTMEFVQQIQDTLNYLENVQFDAFPSGHTLITLLITFFMFRYKSSYRIIFSINAFFLILATVYLQYHYVIDVIIGTFLAIILYFLFNPLKIHFQSSTSDFLSSK